MGEIDPELVGTAIGLFGAKVLAVGWFATAIRAIGATRSLYVDIEDALPFIARLEYVIIASALVDNTPSVSNVHVQRGIILQGLLARFLN